jgi:hypothetical protein
MNENKNFLWPVFPENMIGLMRGSILTACFKIIYQGIIIPKGKEIAIGFDGEYVRSGYFTFNLDYLIEDILIGYWDLSGNADLNEPAQSYMFITNIERRRVLMHKDD